MKTFLCFAVGSLIFSIAKANESNGPLAPYHAKCMAQTGLDIDTAAKIVFSSRLPEDDPLKKYIACLAEESGYMKDGRLDTERIIEEMSKVYEKSEAVALFEECSINRGPAPDDIAYSFIACLYEKENKPMAVGQIVEVQK